MHKEVHVAITIFKVHLKALSISCRLHSQLQLCIYSN